MLLPKICINKITDITVDFLNDNNIKGLLIDIDNTILTPKYELIPNLVDWVNYMKDNNIRLCCVSDTNSIKKQKMIINALNVNVIINACKPFKKGFKKGLKYINLNNTEVAMVGDQIFTDILGGNLLGIYTIYVEPADLEDEDFLISIRRPIERIILKKYRK